MSGISELEDAVYAPEPSPIPSPPPWIRRNDRACERWQSLWPGLDRSRIDATKHLDFVCMYCMAYARAREALEKIDSLGAMVKDKHDRVVANPYVAIYDAAIKQMAEIGLMLGIRPDHPTVPIRRYAEYAGTYQGLGEAAADGDTHERRSVGDAGANDSGELGGGAATPDVDQLRTDPPPQLESRAP